MQPRLSGHKFFAWRYLLSALVVLLSIAPSLARETKPSGNASRLFFGPSIGIYTIKSKHAANPSTKASFRAGFKREYRIGRDFRSFLMFGVEYSVSGLNYSSYYFKPDSLKLYTGYLGYKYSLVLNELDVPLQYKLLFKREDNNLFSPYMVVGYHLRYMLPASLSVTQDGATFAQGKPEIKFRTPLFIPSLNSGLNFSLGWQRNNLTKGSVGSFFMELTCYYGFSQFYFQEDYSATSVYISQFNICLLLGLKF